ncbi:MAG TPA: hypothetical protein VLK65_23810 [Vicinamibacteria bacterium]|nr:hypothetical protein [Vicinamibacteria bacterium]
MALRPERFLLLVALLDSAACQRTSETIPQFSALVEELSEDGGYFDTDNLISNETSYAEVVDRLEPTGGVYLGVGPEQNFHYIGRLKPSWAFIIDIRRDNMLHHLLLNYLLVSSPTPYDYLCTLFSRRCEEGAIFEGFEEMVAAFESAPRDERRFADNRRAAFLHVETVLKFSLDENDRKAIDSIYSSFFEEQLHLRFRSFGRPPMAYHPTYRQLLLSRARSGRPGHFLARPRDYEYVRSLAKNGRLIPVVGDFAGDKALRAIGNIVARQGEVLSAFYLSNVEFYLLRSGSFPAFVDNLRALPHGDGSLLIRAYFSYGYQHPAALPGHRSTLVRQKLARFLQLYDEGAYHTFWDVSTLDYEP